MGLITKIKIYLLRRKVEQIEARLRKGMLMKEWSILEEKRNFILKEIAHYHKIGNKL